MKKGSFTTTAGDAGTNNTAHQKKPGLLSFIYLFQ